ncbi:hypothetical protein MPSEU_001074200 [Mayamaea pseudoterrestris]|nr:hypothetical protein MPSEU_001074200 [Mayamaea pseudoterrestris]
MIKSWMIAWRSVAARKVDSKGAARSETDNQRLHVSDRSANTTAPSQRQEYGSQCFHPRPLHRYAYTTAISSHLKLITMMKWTSAMALATALLFTLMPTASAEFGVVGRPRVAFGLSSQQYAAVTTEIQDGEAEAIYMNEQLSRQQVDGSNQIPFTTTAVTSLSLQESIMMALHSADVAVTTALIGMSKRMNRCNIIARSFVLQTFKTLKTKVSAAVETTIAIETDATVSSTLAPAPGSITIHMTPTVPTVMRPNMTIECETTTDCIYNAVDVDTTNTYEFEWTVTTRLPESIMTFEAIGISAKNTFVDASKANVTLAPTSSSLTKPCFLAAKEETALAANDEKSSLFRVTAFESALMHETDAPVSLILPDSRKPRETVDEQAANAGMWDDNDALVAIELESLVRGGEIDAPVSHSVTREADFLDIAEEWVESKVTQAFNKIRSVIELAVEASQQYQFFLGQRVKPLIESKIEMVTPTHLFVVILSVYAHVFAHDRLWYSLKRPKNESRTYFLIITQLIAIAVFFIGISMASRDWESHLNLEGFVRMDVPATDFTYWLFWTISASSAMDKLVYSSKCIDVWERHDPWYLLLMTFYAWSNVYYSTDPDIGYLENISRRGMTIFHSVLVFDFLVLSYSILAARALERRRRIFNSKAALLIQRYSRF